MNRVLSAVLPTEPLLDESSVPLASRAVDSPTRQCLQDLGAELELPRRCERLYARLRKYLGAEEFHRLGAGILSFSVKGDPTGIAVLAAFVSVRAPGERLVQRVREFTSLRRQLRLAERATAAGNSLSPSAVQLLRAAAELDRALADRYDESLDCQSDELVAVDWGQTRIFRRAFGALIAELEATESLTTAHLQDFLSIATLELDAREQRAGSLAEAIDPYAARQISRIMPVLGDVDSEIHDLRAFISEVSEKLDARLLLQRRPRGYEYLDTREWKKLRDELGQDPNLRLLQRILLGIERNPLPSQTLGYFTERLVTTAERLVKAKLRRRSLDVPTAVAHVLDFHREGVLRLPASPRIVEALREEPPEGVELLEGGLRLVFDPSAAKRLALPYGLPVPLDDRPPAPVDPGVEPSVKDLVLANLNKTSVLLGLLKNAKVVNTPGVVAMVAQRTRNLRVLDIISQTRKLHSGFANKDVPLALLRSPANIPIKTLRKFINVRYVSKIDLRRLAKDRSAIRREVADEIEAYLLSLT